MKLSGIRQIEVLADQESSLDTICYRGSGATGAPCPDLTGRRFRPGQQP